MSEVKAHVLIIADSLWKKYADNPNQNFGTIFQSHAVQVSFIQRNGAKLNTFDHYNILKNTNMFDAVIHGLGTA